jgi:sugar lactone lactonase YvrE
MGARELVTLLSGGHYFEAPRWRDGHWWVSDFYRHTVFTVEPDGRAEDVLELEDGAQPSGLGWLPDGSLLVASMLDRRLLRRAADGSVSEYADVSEHCGGHLNDMVVAEDGTVYAGNFGFDLMAGADAQPASLVRVAPDGAVSVAAEDLIFPNGSVIDGSTLLVNETLAGRITAFDIEPGGALSNRRVWAQLQETPAVGPLAEMIPGSSFAPDGLTLDAEGHVWAANALGGPVARISPAGEVVDTIELPEGLAVFACMLGGPEGNTLLMCAAPDFAEENRKAAREALLLTTTVEVAGA